VLAILFHRFERTPYPHIVFTSSQKECSGKVTEENTRWSTHCDLGTVEQLLEDDGAAQDRSDCQKDAHTLDELRFVAGDYLCLAVTPPKNAQANLSTDPVAQMHRWALSSRGPGGIRAAGLMRAFGRACSWSWRARG
jgi:hypothetical protein